MGARGQVIRTAHHKSSHAYMYTKNAIKCGPYSTGAIFNVLIKIVGTEGKYIDVRV